ncbi:alpha/beta hydrolase [Verticiella sediminum]|uniref:Alpha/beta hydrolase n=1 Tax=Verticiella sediminum TaxID=1247510 RepID=A0A556AB38_9BURK|nr:alpha/beta hydrolase [Verticiella sediminum]TSH90093.1 alpha/beta hydrolase [Verticiella sediminum]
MKLATTEPSPPSDLAMRLDSAFPLTLVSLDDGARMACRQAGRGPAVVLLHGIGSGAGSWLEVAEQLSRTHRVLAWDAPGYGESDPLAAQAPGAADYAARLDALLARLDVHDYVLVGHSLGAIVARQQAAHGERRPRKVLLLSPAPGYGAAAPERRAAVRARRLQALADGGVAGIAERRSAAMLSPAATPGQVAWVAWNTRRISERGYAQAIELLCGGDLLAPAAPQVHAVHVGEHDTITPVEQSRAAAQALNAPFGLIEAAGHACHIEQPAQVAGIIEGFCADATPVI